MQNIKRLERIERRWSYKNHHELYIVTRARVSENSLKINEIFCYYKLLRRL